MTTGHLQKALTVRARPATRQHGGSGHPYRRNQADGGQPISRRNMYENAEVEA